MERCRLMERCSNFSPRPLADRRAIQPQSRGAATGAPKGNCRFRPRECGQEDCAQKLITADGHVCIRSGCDGQIIWQGSQQQFLAWWDENDPVALADGIIIESAEAALSVASRFEKFV